MSFILIHKFFFKKKKPKYLTFENYSLYSPRYEISFIQFWQPFSTHRPKNHRLIDMTAQGISCTKKKIVTLSFTRHRRKEVVSLVFDRDEQLIECVKTLPGVAWSRSRKFWYIEPGKFWLDKVFEAFRGRAWLDYSSLRRAKGEMMH